MSAETIAREHAAELAVAMAPVLLQSMVTYGDKSVGERIAWWHGFLGGVAGTMASATSPEAAAVIFGAMQAGLREMTPNV